ncbi:MAG TPA: CapA family protein [Nitriliruptorales bacterium]
MRQRALTAALVVAGGLAAAGLAWGAATLVRGPSPSPTGLHTIVEPTGSSAPGDPTGVASPTSDLPVVRPVVLAFAGDVHFEDFLREPLLADPDGLLGPAVPLFAGADHVVVNLETAVTTRGTPWPKMYNFRSPPEAFTALRAVGVDAVTLANNHTLDYRLEGLGDTLEHAEAAGMATFGAGPDLASALAPLSVTINGQRIAFLGAAEVLTDEAWVARDAIGDQPARPGMPGAQPRHREALLAAVAAAADGHDVVVVYLHWGEEHVHCPGSRQTSLVGPLVAAGATIIIGAHPHDLQGYGFVDGALVHYSLGNFVWWTRGPGDSRSSETGVMHVRIDPDGTMTPEWRPAQITDGIPAPVPAADEPAYRARMDQWIACAGL